MRRSGDTVAIPGDYQYRALHGGNAVQRFWHHSKQVTISRYLPPQAGDFVLDVGCGSGVIADFLAQRAATVIGVDGNDAAIAFARRTFARSNLRFERGLVDHDFALPRPADKIYCLEVIEHIYPEQALDMLRVFHRHLAAGGRVYLTTPNSHSAWPAIEWLLDFFKLTPHMSGEQHVASYSRRSLAALCREAGFTVERTFTTSLFAPWLAPLSWKLAEAVNALESGAPFGCILACVAKKGGA
jgi:2-polyprenyl-3-methyl-5-hydroxy-6-metoxy-1,4-benzoquinol methylase